MEAERKLAEFRARKKRQEQINNVKEKIKNVFTWNSHSTDDSVESEVLINTSENTIPEENLTEVVNCDQNEPEIIQSASKLRREFYILFFILWAATYYLFIMLQFGTVYLIVSGIVGMYFNTRTGPKDANEVSAYSVFNRNCESIDGTLKAEQFEREIRYGPMNVH